MWVRGRQALLTSPEQDSQLAAPSCIMAGPFISLQSSLSSPRERLQVHCAGALQVLGPPKVASQDCMVSSVCTCKHLLLPQGQGNLFWWSCCRTTR